MGNILLLEFLFLCGKHSDVGIIAIPVHFEKTMLFSDIRVFHKHTQLAIMALLPTSYSHIFAIYDISKCDTRHQWVQADYISRLKTLLVLFISNGTAKQSWQYCHSCILESLFKTL